MPGAMPTICVANAVDTLRVLADRGGPAARDAVFAECFAQQDQAIFWQPWAKLLITEQPVADLAWQCEFLGRTRVTNLSPGARSGSVFADIVADDALLWRICDYAGPGRRLRLLPHTTTADLWEFVRVLATRFGVYVELPESTESQELRDRIDTKSGFRELVAECGLEGAPARMADGQVCADRAEAADAVRRMITAGRPCVVKPDRGEASVGLVVIRPSDPVDGIPSRLRQNPYLGEGEPIVVEEYICGDRVVFPSVEFVLPAEPGRAPLLTHVCDMLFGRPTEVRGNVTGGVLHGRPWYENFAASGTVIAEALRKRGYRGHFGIDAVALADGTVFMLDLNSRRTGSTHLHDFGLEFFGPDYARDTVIGHYDFYDVPSSTADVLRALAPIVRSPQSHDEGFVPCELTGLSTGRLSSVIFARTMDRFHALADRAMRMLRTAANEREDRR